MENEKPEKVQKPENMLPNGELNEQRSLSAVVIAAGEIAGTAGLVKVVDLGVDAAAEKIKDVLAPKDQGPKIELPPGVEK